ncbi:hypothetical protein Q4Q39_18345 [Flavivirga amylovorans]|uniref:T9SS C-terminal target domain-containing protein n=1 Tax=Flavivirga amylovorans TaxID=870486 RepID=A0ABT8X652_9FLAO|nr:hypothetical protein [Flavivirga amylovorans]MDO5989369.1 hypothetical protein [Flavivirga amylovorans]
MKNVIKTIEKNLLLVTMMLFAVMIGNATEISSFNVKGDLKGTALTIDNVKKGNLLSIRDYNGIIIYKELIQSTGSYTKGFDLTELPDGNYFFELDKDLQIETIPFAVENNKVVFDKTKEAIIFKPYIRKKNDLVYISKLAPNLEPLKIRVYARSYDGAFQLMHTEKIEGAQVAKKIYKLRKGGNYKIILNANDKEYTEFINN